MFDISYNSKVVIINSGNITLILPKNQIQWKRERYEKGRDSYQSIAMLDMKGDILAVLSDDISSTYNQSKYNGMVALGNMTDIITDIQSNFYA